MTVTEAQVQQLIVLEVGDTEENDLLINMPAIWASFADKATIAPRLQELYAKRRCIDILLGTLSGQVDFSIAGGLGIKQSQQVAHLQAMRATTETEIAAVMRQAAITRGPAVGQITTVYPVPTPGPLPVFGPPDPSDMRYSGTPFRGLPWPR